MCLSFFVVVQPLVISVGRPLPRLWLPANILGPDSKQHGERTRRLGVANHSSVRCLQPLVSTDSIGRCRAMRLAVAFQLIFDVMSVEPCLKLTYIGCLLWEPVVLEAQPIFNTR